MEQYRETTFNSWIEYKLFMESISVGTIESEQLYHGPFPDKKGVYIVPATCSAYFAEFDGEKWIDSSTNRPIGFYYKG